MLNFKTTSLSLYITAVHRAPTGNCNLFLNRLDDSVRSIYRANLNLILCGDINIDYLTENDRKRQLDSMLLTYNLTTIVIFLLDHRVPLVLGLVIYLLTTQKFHTILSFIFSMVYPTVMLTY